MEIRARYLQMGIFTLGVMLAAFAFVYWLNNAGGLRERAVFRINFTTPVSGLLRGSAVLFNGIRVGEVTALGLSPDDPRLVRVDISIDRGTPVRADTKVGIEFQGLTGSPVISLTGGSPTSPPVVLSGEMPLLVAEAGAGASMTQAARDVLRRLDNVLAENAEPLRKMVASLDTFTGALARNSDRVDGIVAGLERMTGGAAAKARVMVYDLSVAHVSLEAKSSTVQLVVSDPTALTQLDSDRILSMSGAGATTAFPDAQWSDMLPRLLQLKIVRAMEDANQFAGVNRPVEGLNADVQLLTDIRKFQVTESAAATADVEFVGKLLGGNGRIIATQVFRATSPVEGTGAQGAVAALDRAFARAVAELIPWVVRKIDDRRDKSEPAPPAVSKKGVNR